MDAKTIEQKLKTMYEKRTERLKLTARAAVLEQEEKNIHQELADAKLTAGLYGNYALTSKVKVVPKCDDWTKFHTYILTSGNIEMLHKRVTETAVMEHINAGEIIPGISTDDKVTYTVKEV